MSIPISISENFEIMGYGKLSESFISQTLIAVWKTKMFPGDKMQKVALSWENWHFTF